MDLKDFTPEQRARMRFPDDTPASMQEKHQAIAKPSKYKNVKVIIEGEKFDSRHEADVWLLLRAREKAGDITNLRRQVPFPIYVPVFADGILAPVAIAELCTYVCDFVFLDMSGTQIAMDAKGQKKRICPYPLKAKAMTLSYGIVIEEV